MDFFAALEATKPDILAFRQNLGEGLFVSVEMNLEKKGANIFAPPHFNVVKA